MRLNMRMIAKVGFLLAAGGFFMPVACDANAFQFIGELDKTSNALIVGLFTLALIGVLIGVLLLAKVKIPGAVDWLVILGFIASYVVFFTRLDISFEKMLELQYGVHVISTGMLIALFGQCIALFVSDKPRSASSEKISGLSAILIACGIGGFLVCGLGLIFF